MMTAAIVAAATAVAEAQNAPSAALRVGPLPSDLHIDGALSETAWAAAEASDAFTQIDPTEGAAPSGRTVIRVLADAKAIAIGIVCDDPDPSGIVSFSVQRDAELNSEDHLSIVLGTFMDGRSGYLFSVNPAGARYDGLISPGGEDENAEWDGIWEAATARTPAGWSAELRIPVQTLSFKPGLREWHFNVQRRIQRLLEVTRWASPVRQYEVTQTSRAGMITDLPPFDLGVGLSIRPALTTGGGVPAPDVPVEGEFQPSLDLTQRLGSNVLASFTANTDFAETEVDTRRTNLTRFPLFFPEKRTFFLEGDDIFAFGLGLDEDVIPYFSRRIGLAEGTEVPIIAGGKINGRLRNTNFGGLVVATNDEPGVVPTETGMAVARVKQNVLQESWVGAIGSVGDPLARTGSWMAGADFTYATSRFRGDKNFLVGLWGVATGRDDLGTDTTAHGLKIDYPNDLWDAALTYKRIGRDFDPSLGFVPRRAVQLYNLSIDNRTRIARGPLQQLTHEFRPFVATDLGGRWESYEVFIAPVNWRFRSGDRFEFNANPTGERLVEAFEIADGVIIPPGSYHWRRYRLEVGTARKRRLYSQIRWWFGGFYDGELDQIEWEGAWNPIPLFTVEFSGERNIGRMASGNFTQTLVGTRLRVNISPDLSIASYVQYDTDSDSVGVNTRLRWTFSPAGDLFVVYNQNVQSLLDRWQLASNQLLIKLQYALRY
jgi:Domain of unknown function (DUF5916)